MPTRTLPPPRLLIGAALLFWGAMTGRPLVGLVLALLVESPQWLRVRWDFDDAAFARAWQLVLLLSVGLVALLFIDGEREMVMPMLVGWMPALLLPMQLAQTFGMRPAIPLTTLSFFAKRRRERNQRLGIEEPEVMFHFGNAYFAVVLLAAALGVWAEGRLFLPGLLALCAWRFLALPGRRSAAVVGVIVVSGAMAMLGQIGLNSAYEWLSRGGRGDPNYMSDATHGYTAIGSMQDLKLSPEIKWRLKPEPGTRMPRLLRRAAFNRYLGVRWEIARPPGSPSADALFEDLDIIEPVSGESYYLPNPQIGNQDAVDARLARFTMRGSAKPGGAFPLPGNVASFRDFDLDGAQRNPLTTVRVFPAAPVIDGTVLWQADAAPDGEPIEEFDLMLPRLEADMLARTADAIGLDPAMTTGEKLTRIQNWFNTEFQYTLYLSMGPTTHSIREGTAIGRFLETTRRGHCEYFATSAALLLRQVGVPTRFVTGYAVVERDARRNEYLIRGTHGHAWCRVWLAEEGRWIDFDPTPSDWSSLEATGDVTRMQRILDALKRAREDLFIWRSDPENRRLMLFIIFVPTLIGMLWLGRRLWKSRHGGAIPAKRLQYASGAPSALFNLESLAARRLGPRPEGVPFAEWLQPLAQELPDHLDSFREAIELHQRLRYDPAPPDAAIDAKLDALTRALRQAMKHAAKAA